jgi:hypothetical protein
MSARKGWMFGALAIVMAQSALAVDGGLHTTAQTGATYEPWSRIQGRLTLGVSSATLYSESTGFDAGAPRLNSVSLLGDYYLSRSLGGGSTGGLRATSGVLLGPRATLWGGLPSQGLFQIDRRAGAGSPTLDTGADGSTVPYLGIGYTSVSLRGSWGMSFDLGLMAMSPRATGQFGSVLNGTQSLDTTLRELRLSPILQLGVSYSF